MKVAAKVAVEHPPVGASFLGQATDYDAWLERTRQRLHQVR